HTNNTFNAITVGTGFNNILTSPTIGITAAGALSGVTGYTQASGNFDASASGGNFLTSTGTVTLGGDTSVAGSHTFTVGTGLTSLGGALNVTGAGAFSSTLAVTTLGANTGAVGICRNSSNQISTCGSNPDAVTLQQAYDATSGNTINTADNKNIA